MENNEELIPEADLTEEQVLEAEDPETEETEGTAEPETAEGEEKTEEAAEENSDESSAEDSEKSGDGKPSEETEGNEEPEVEIQVKPDYVKATLESGIVPLELRFCQINDCYNKRPIAYRTETVINSVTMGVLKHDRYSYAADTTEQGIRLARWNIVEGMKTIKKFEEAGRHIEWLSVKCPAGLAAEVDMYDWMKQLMEENDFHTPEKLCLEFPQSLLFDQSEKVQISILNLKLLNIKSMMSGCAASDCPIGNLLDCPVDMVLLDESKTRLTGDRDKGHVINSLIQYIRSMNIDIIAEGVIEDDQLSVLSRAECIGYIISDDYYGYIDHGSKTMTLEEAIAQKEEEN